MNPPPNRDASEALHALERLYQRKVIPLEMGQRAARILAGDEAYVFPQPRREEPPAPPAEPAAEKAAETVKQAEGGEAAAPAADAAEAAEKAAAPPAAEGAPETESS